MIDVEVLTVICIVIAQQCQQMKQMCPAMSTNEANVERVQEFVRSDRRKSVAQIAPEVGIPVRSCHSIPHDVLNMFRVHQHLVS